MKFLHRNCHSASFWYLKRKAVYNKILDSQFSHVKDFKNMVLILKEKSGHGFQMCSYPCLQCLKLQLILKTSNIWDILSAYFRFLRKINHIYERREDKERSIGLEKDDGGQQGLIFVSLNFMKCRFLQMCGNYFAVLKEIRAHQLQLTCIFQAVWCHQQNEEDFLLVLIL